MAQLPTSLRGICDFVKPVMLELMSRYGVVMDVWADHMSDNIKVAAMHGSERCCYIMLSRQEIESDLWHRLAGERLGKAVAAVLPQQANQFADEYDDIMQSQAIMDELKP